MYKCTRLPTDTMEYPTQRRRGLQLQNTIYCIHAHVHNFSVIFSLYLFIFWPQARMKLLPVVKQHLDFY